MLGERENRIKELEKQLAFSIEKGLDARENKAARLNEIIQANDPSGIMKKGYAAVLDKDRNLVRSTEDIEKDDDLTLIFRDGEADSRVTGIRRKPDER